MSYVVVEADKDKKVRCPNCHGQCKVKGASTWRRDFYTGHYTHIGTRCDTCESKGWILKSELTFLKLKGLV